MNSVFDWCSPTRIKICSTLGDEFMPVRSDRDNAGIDLRTPVDINLPPGCEMIVDTGLIIDVSDFDFPLYTMLVPRSGAGFKYGLEFKNTIGIIDRNYRGPNDTIKVAISRKDTTPIVRCFENAYDAVQYWTFANETGIEGSQDWQIIKRSDAVYIVDNSPVKTKLYKAGERFAQLIVTPYCPARTQAMSMDNIVVESRGGVGSTGVK